jgi:hypothetical protein
MTLNHTLNHDMFPSVAMGERRGRFTVNKFGRNLAVGTSFVPVATGGIYRTKKGSEAVALRIKAGGNAADTAAGAGARSVTLFGLDEGFNYVEETVATAGALASAATTALFTRLFRIRVATSGTYATQATGSHAGPIVIEDSAGAEDWGTIQFPAGGFAKGTSDIGAYSVATGHTAYIVGGTVFTNASKTTDVLLFVREGIDEEAAPFSVMRVLRDLTLRGGSDSLSIALPFKVTGPADIGFMAKVDLTTALVDVDFDLIVVSDTAP